MNAREVLEFAKKNKVQVVDLKFVDLIGTWQHFSIPIEELRVRILISLIDFAHRLISSMLSAMSSMRVVCQAAQSAANHLDLRREIVVGTIPKTRTA